MGVFVLLTILFASLTILEHGQASTTTTTATVTTTATTTATVTTTSQSSSSSSTNLTTTHCVTTNNSIGCVTVSGTQTMGSCTILPLGKGLCIHVVTDNGQPVNGTLVEVYYASPICPGVTVLVTAQILRTNATGWVNYDLNGAGTYKFSLQYASQEYGFSVLEKANQTAYATVKLPSGDLSIAYRISPLIYLTASGICTAPGGYAPCWGGDAYVFNCAGQNLLSGPATQQTCTQQVTSSLAPHPSYVINITLPGVNQPNEPSWANCMWIVQGITPGQGYAYCIAINSTSFIMGQQAPPHL